MLENMARREVLEDGGVVLNGEQVDMLGEGGRYVSNSVFCSFSLSLSLSFFF